MTMTRSMMALPLTTVLLGFCTTTCCVSAFRSTPMHSPLIIQPSNLHHYVQVEEKQVHSRNIWSNHLHTSRRGSASALSAFPTPNIAVVGAGVARFYKAAPLLAGFLTASTKAALADSTAQLCDDTKRFDVKRNLAMALYSGLVLGISMEIMFNTFFPRMFGLEDSFARAVKCTLFDGFINAPFLWLPPAYVVKAMIFRNSKREAIKKYITDVRENGLLKKYWLLWLPAMMVNFLFVPAHFRVAYTASVSFFWMILLSTVANNPGK